jgi:hypothetical protein
LAGVGDPELADLLGIDSGKKESPNFDTLFGETEEKKEQEAKAKMEDISKQKFERVKKIKEDKPRPIFNDKDYYKKVLMGGGEVSKRVHTFVTKFLGSKDPQDKTMYRNRLIPAFWDFESNIAQQIANLSLPKRLILRYGVLSPAFLSKDQQDTLARIIFDNQTDEPVHYVDEWLTSISQGKINLSAQDEVKAVKKTSAQRKIDIVDKRKGTRDAEMSLLNNKIVERERYETELLQRVKELCIHQKRPEYKNLPDAYTSEQRSSFSNITEALRHLSLIDREIVRGYKKLGELSEEIGSLENQLEGVEVSDVDTDNLRLEFNSIRQMAKLCVGRQGNHFPILMKQYFRAGFQDLGTRENVVNIMAQIEELDQSLFHRSYKGQVNRIVPHVIIIPCYGDYGICWEPFEKRNRASGRGRIAIPLFPKNLKEAILYALADLRWQVAKEKAMHYWMEEGFTGRYYQWFEAQKLKGDVKDYFIKDYILWITKESNGTQKLEREVRGIFWRMLPFPQSVKDKLKNRGFVYDELYKKDMNIARSDGY